MFRRQPTGINIVAATVVLLALLGYVFAAFKDFSDKAYQYTYEINEKRLQELSAQSIDTVRLEFERARAAMEITAASFAAFEDLHSPAAHEQLGRIIKFSGFDRMWLVDGENRASDKDGHTIVIPERSYFRLAREGLSGIVKVDRSSYTNEEVFAVYSPIDHNGKFDAIALGVYERRSLAVKTENPQFDGLGYSHVFDKSGKLIIKSEHPGSLVAETNIWDFLRTASFGKDSDRDKMYRAVQEYGSGIVAYAKDGQERIGYYAPIGVNDWFMLSSAPRSVVSSYSDSIDTFAFALLLKVFLCFGLLVAGIVHYSRRARNELMRLNSLLDVSNQRFRVAAFHLSNAVLEYDIAGNALYRVNNSSVTGNAEKRLTDPAGELLKNAVIDADSLPKLLSLLKNMREGEKFGSCLLTAEREDGGIEWHRVTFTNVLEPSGKPSRAIGTIENVTAQRERELRFTREEGYRQAMLAEMLETFVVNVTRERYLYGHFAGESPHRDAEPIEASGIGELLGGEAHPDWREKVERDFSCEQLRRHFGKGVSRIELEFRGLDRAYGESWLNCVANLVVDPESKDLFAYAYLKDVTKEKLEELELKREAERDPLTNLYNRRTALRMIEEHARSLPDRKESIDAFLLIDLDRFKHVNDTYGHAAGDETLRQMAIKLVGIFRKSDVIGRLGGDEFVAYMKDANSVKLIRDKADAVCAALKDIVLSADPGYRVSGSVGVCLAPGYADTPADLYSKADVALYAAKKAGKDRYAIYDPSEHDEGATPAEPNRHDEGRTP